MSSQSIMSSLSIMVPNIIVVKHLCCVLHFIDISNAHSKWIHNEWQRWWCRYFNVDHFEFNLVAFIIVMLPRSRSQGIGKFKIEKEDRIVVKVNLEELWWTCICMTPSVYIISWYLDQKNRFVFKIHSSTLSVKLEYRTENETHANGTPTYRNMSNRHANRTTLNRDIRRDMTRNRQICLLFILPRASNKIHVTAD